MKNLYNIIILLCLFLGVCSCEEDTIEPVFYGKITGKVLDLDTNLPLDGAEISTSPATTNIFSAADGSFAYDKVAVGTYGVRATFQGYVTSTESIIVTDGDITNVTIKLAKNTDSNTLPIAPAYVVPANGGANLANNITFRWSNAVDADGNDSVRYHLLLYTDIGNPDTVAYNIKDTFYLANNLMFATTYFWQVITTDQANVAVYGPVYSFTTKLPPNNRILFARQLDGKFDIWSVKEDGTDQFRLTNTGANNYRPRWNHQRTKIAYLSDTDISPQLYIMLADGSQPMKITTLPLSGGFSPTELDFCWKPDGTKLLYMNQNKLYTINTDGSGLAQLATAPAGFTFTEVDWNGVTNQILARITGNSPYQSRILLLSETGATITTKVEDTAGTEQGPAFSIIGTKFLYTQDMSGLEVPDGRQLDSRIMIKDIAGNFAFNASSLKNAGTNDLDARYSADGSKIIFVNTNNDGISQKNIFTMNLDGSTRTMIIENGMMPDWR